MDTISAGTTGTLVVHGDHATLFAAIPDGTPRATLTGDGAVERTLTIEPDRPVPAGRPSLTGWRRPGLQSLARGA